MKEGKKEGRKEGRPGGIGFDAAPRFVGRHQLNLPRRKEGRMDYKKEERKEGL